MEAAASDSVILRATSKGWNKVDLRRDGAPWLTFPRWGDGFSLDGKDYTVARCGRGGLELGQTGESIVVAQDRGGLFSRALELDDDHKPWVMKKKMGASSGGAALECAGERVGEFETQGFSFGTIHNARLPKDLPDAMQIFLVWIYLHAIGVNSSS